MTERIDAEVRVARWLTDEAEARAPERLIHATRERIGATRQIGGLRALRLRLRPTTVITRTGILVVGVLAIAVALVGVGSLLALGPGSGVGLPSASPTPRPSLTSLAPAACPFSGGGTCLGPLQAGVYETHSFVPGIGYVVPDGWTNTLDVRTEVDLPYDAGGSYRYPDGITFHDGISIFRRPIAVSPLGTPIGGVGKAARDLAQWLDAHANLDASDLTSVTIGGIPGYRVKLSVPQGPSSSTDRCTDHGVPACVSLFAYDDPAATGGFGIVGPESAVVYLLDAPSGDTVMVVIDDVDGVDPDGLIAAGTPVVDSLVFTP